MKVVIDIDEGFYNTIKSNGYKIYSGKVYEMIRKGEPLGFIMDDIRTEVRELCVDLQDGSEEWRSYVNDTLLEVEDILDKYSKTVIVHQETSLNDTYKNDDIY